MDDEQNYRDDDTRRLPKARTARAFQERHRVNRIQLHAGEKKLRAGKFAARLRRALRLDG